MRNRTTLLRAESREQRAESREQRAESREQRAITVPFLRLVTAWRLKLNTTFEMDNRLT